MSRWSLFCFAAASLSAAACHAPKHEVTVDQVASIAKLSDLMDAQATYADPMFKKRGQTSFTDEEFATFVDSAARLQATSMKIKDFSKGPAFDAFAITLNGHINELHASAQAKDAGATRAALTAMKATCRECHSKFK